MAYDGLVPLTLVVSHVLTSSWSFSVFLGSFSAQCDPEMARLPPRVWSLAASFSCSASPRLACLEQGLVLGWGVCVGAHVHASCVPTQEWSPPCLASERGDRNVPSSGPSKARWVAALTVFTVFLGHFFPCRQGLVAFGRLPWWRRTLDYGKCFNHLCHYLCVLA